MTTTKGAMVGVGKINAAVVASPEDLARQKVLAEANEDFKALHTQIRELLAAEGANIIRSRYRIGELLEDMLNEENKYGSKCVQRMEIALGYEKDIIYQSLRFRKRYDPEEVDRLLTARTKVGDPVMWTHVVHLSTVEDSEERNKLQQTILDNNLTPAQLLAYMQKKQGGKKSHGGRPLARPKSLRGFVDQQFAVLDQLLNRKAKVWAGVEKVGEQSFFDLLNSTPPEKVDSSMLTELEQLENKYENASVELDNMATELLRARKRVEMARSRSDEDEDGEEISAPPAAVSPRKSKNKPEPVLD